MGINLTDNYGLKKPEKNEFFDVQHQNDNMDRIDEQMKNNANAMLKKNGSIQMDGPLKTVGSTTTIPASQIEMGKNAIMTRDGKVVYLAVNCYHDGTDWRYKGNGKALVVTFGVEYDFPIMNVADIGTKDAVISFRYVNMLTNETGLPLTGGTVAGDITIDKKGALGKTLIMKNSDATIDYGTQIYDHNQANSYAALVLNANLELNSKAVLYVSGTTYNLYGTHNIIVSTISPSSALNDGAQHQVY
ncbi:hypothetical protein Ami103574_04635 [Aminipila butyrica]|uniref:Uncharacterized protein n=1 Tax=Aminipila butyrica TaxID=433296 RepID=A0A858BTX9_9FIRM|nr:hypothetical protein [Aminipila butyrica]QIB68649.1 hypothetical protein Ami103574_04635 [Aminipila butyrica]